MAKLKATDTTMDAALKMSEGNPGALQVVMNLMQDPNPHGFMRLLSCDSIGLYGSKLYMLWNDCCGRNMVKFNAVIDAWQQGRISTETIMEHVSGGWGTPFEEEFINAEV